MKILRRSFYILVFVLTFCYVALMYMPINYFKPQIDRALPPGLILVGVEGSLAKGKVRELSFNGINISNLNWKFNPFLLKLKVNIPAKKDWNISARLGFGGLKINLLPGSLDFISVPMVSLAGQFDGELNYKVNQNLVCKFADGQVKADKIAVLSPMQTDLQKLSINLACESEKTAIAVKSADARLSADMQLLLDKKSLTINAKGKLGEHDLTPLLQTMVRPNNDGSFKLKRKMPLHF